jgi:lysophospholipase L1-like esterase
VPPPHGKALTDIEKFALMKIKWSNVLYVLYLIFLLVVADFVVGLVYNRVAPPLGQRNIKILLGDLEDEEALNERPHPYLLWENTPNFISEEGIKQTNSLGYRNKEDFNFTKDEKVFRILALGGSTTWGYLLDDPDDAWPAQLEQLLNAALSENSDFDKIEVINGGLNYATSAELLLHYLFRDRYLEPDIVILHTGGNDAKLLLFHDYDPDYSFFRPGWEADIHRLRTGEGFLIRHSNIAKLFYAFWLNDSAALPHINKQSKSLDLRPSYYVENAEKNEPIGFERNLDLLIRNIISDGAQPIVFPFVMVSEEQFEVLSAESAARVAFTRKIHAGSVIALAKNYEVMRNLSSQYQIPLITLSPDEIPTDYFLDNAHLSKEGEAIKARFVASNICQQVPHISCDAFR